MRSNITAFRKSTCASTPTPRGSSATTTASPTVFSPATIPRRSATIARAGRSRSTDQGLNWDGLPGYLKLPVEADVDLKSYLKRVTPVAANAQSANWLQNTPKYVVSLLKAWWGDHAKSENDFDFSHLPKLGRGFEGK